MTTLQDSSIRFGNQDAQDLDTSKHLVFRLANEYYATPLVSIREILRMQPIKPVPFMVEYFRGILNLRGLIVSIIDLRLKLQLPCPDAETGLLIVIDCEGGAIGTVVDDVVSVANFLPENIETKLALKTKIPADYFLGVGNFNNHMVYIIDIAGTLSIDDFATVRRVKESSA